MEPFDFAESPEFSKNWSRLGLGDVELQALQIRLMTNPEEGQVIPGTGGYRKLRIPLKSKGKRGGARVVYIVYRAMELIRLSNVYGKNE